MPLSVWLRPRLWHRRQRQSSSDRHTQCHSLRRDLPPNEVLVEFHADAREEGPSKGIAITPKQTTTLAPGGAYVLLLDIKKHLEVGWGLEMTLTFEKAGDVVIDAAIEAPDAAHAHDADAQARWEKAHNKDTAGPAGAPPAPAPHDHDHHDAMPGMPAPSTGTTGK